MLCSRRQKKGPARFRKRRPQSIAPSGSKITATMAYLAPEVTAGRTRRQRPSSERGGLRPLSVRAAGPWAVCREAPVDGLRAYRQRPRPGSERGGFVGIPSGPCYARPFALKLRWANGRGRLEATLGQRPWSPRSCAGPTAVVALKLRWANGRGRLEAALAKASGGRRSLTRPCRISFFALLAQGGHHIAKPTVPHCHRDPATLPSPLCHIARPAVPHCQIRAATLLETRWLVAERLCLIVLPAMHTAKEPLPCYQSGSATLVRGPCHIARLALPYCRRADATLPRLPCRMSCPPCAVFLDTGGCGYVK